jgi:succinylglutamate-semialdehyde dehydrogenase
MDFSRGDFIDNQWIKPNGPGLIRSINPATDGEVVLEAPTDPAHAQLAVDAAARAWPAWAALSPDERISMLRRFARELAPRTEALARAITAEMGKTIREARIEANSLLQRIDLVAEQQLPLVRPWSPPGVAGECRYHPLGVVAVLGPFNFPLHLCHAHIIPALATGNTVVVKPSERTPLAFQRYMEAWAAAGLPPVLHMVQGGPDIGRALLQTRQLAGVAFTGSWRGGHAIQKALLDRPEVLPALEMGGQNMAIVLEDADLEQALEGVLLGGFLTTGQRCTCTARVLVQRSVADAFIERLVAAARQLTFGDPTTDVFMGPMASVGDRDRMEALCRAGREAGAEVLLAAEIRPGGAWRGPSIHMISKDHDSDYTREEVFGPDVAVTIVDHLDDAIDIVRKSPYGLSVSLFSARKAAFEAVYLHTRVGCVNWNRSTNRAVGSMPFGGVGRSGNYRAAGSDAVRYTTYPVQVQWNDPGILENDLHVSRAMQAADPVTALEHRHRLEEALEPWGIYPEFGPNGGLGWVRIPANQLDSAAVQLARPLADALREHGVTAEVAPEGLRITLTPSEADIRRIARALSDGMFAIRHLHPARFLGRRPAGSRVPEADALTLPRSHAMMQRLVANDLVPDDKKPPVIDLHRSSGPYLASVDDDPIVLFDAASQIATHAAGLNPPAVLEALHLGRFGASPIDDGRPEDRAALTRLATLIRGHQPALPHLRLSNSGAEANEVALATASQQRPGRKGVIAFRGAFHGRTMLAIHSTWNPAKRLRFELKGYQTRWVDLPVDDTPSQVRPEPAGWLEYWAANPASRAALASHGDDALLATEIAALHEVEAQLADDGAVAIIAEPMQAEGGERYASNRFFRALRTLATRTGVPFIMDEVQCGFHLGGPFFWHALLDLPTPPDLVTCAKKAQVGATLSRWPIPVSSETATASAIRGTIYGEVLAAHAPGALMALAGEELCRLAGDFPELVLNPRLAGWSFGFDLPTVPQLNHLVNERMWRGYMIYGAGDRGLRFRFHPEITADQVRALFQRLRASLQRLRDGATPATASSWERHGTEGLADKAPAWPAAPMQKLPAGYRLIRVEAAEWPDIRRQYEALQHLVYEPARQDDFEHFTALMEDPDAICFAVVHGQPALPPRGTLVAATVAFPLEHFSDLDGPRQDPTLGAGETLYSADLTVHPDHRGVGLGRALKEAQLAAAMAMARPDGSPRYVFMTGRNRVGATDAMGRLNEEYGAWRVARFTGQYGEPDAQTDYYRINLLGPRLGLRARVTPLPKDTAQTIDFDGGLTRRLGDVRADRPGTSELRDAWADGVLNGSVVNKLSLCNFVTPGLVRAHEYLRLQAPKALGHLIVASGRAEALDKTLRSIKYHRGEGRIVVSLGPVRAGMSTAAARSVSLPETHPLNFFGWPTLPDPSLEAERCLTALRRLLTDTPPEQVLAVVTEPLFAATARAIPQTFWAPLRALLDEFGVPLLLIETTTGGYRSGRGLWRADTLPVPTDALVWFPGGQNGLGFVSDRFYVSEKLTLISTWDGDELGLQRLLLELRAARRLPVETTARELAQMLAAFGPVRGEGLYLALETPQAETLVRRLAEHRIRVGLTEDRQLRIAPPLNLSSAEIAALGRALKESLNP